MQATPLRRWQSWRCCEHGWLSFRWGMAFTLWPAASGTWQHGTALPRLCKITAYAGPNSLLDWPSLIMEEALSQVPSCLFHP